MSFIGSHGKLSVHPEPRISGIKWYWYTLVFLGPIEFSQQHPLLEGAHQEALREFYFEILYPIRCDVLSLSHHKSHQMRLFRLDKSDFCYLCFIYICDIQQ